MSDGGGKKRKSGGDWHPQPRPVDRAGLVLAGHVVEFELAQGAAQAQVTRTTLPRAQAVAEAHLVSAGGWALLEDGQEGPDEERRLVLTIS